MQTFGALRHRWPHWKVSGHRLYDSWRRRSYGHGSRGPLPDVRHGSSWRRYHNNKRDPLQAGLSRDFLIYYWELDVEVSRVQGHYEEGDAKSQLPRRRSLLESVLKRD